MGKDKDFLVDYTVLVQGGILATTPSWPIQVSTEQQIAINVTF